MNAKLRALMLLAGCTVGGLSLMSCDEEKQEEFGFACVEMSKGMAVTGDPFAGTQQIAIKFSYEPCLVSYYTEKHPEQRYDGPADAGQATFEEWKERLCTEEVERRAECVVESITQNLNSGDMLYNMTVVYNIQDSSTIAGRRFLWGPGPLPETAECAEGLSPFVKLLGLADIQGLDGAGNRLWSLQSFGPTPRAIIQSAGTGCVQVDVTD